MPPRRAEPAIRPKRRRNFPPDSLFAAVSVGGEMGRLSTKPYVYIKLMIGAAKSAE
jgi:hypothetical protein